MDASNTTNKSSNNLDVYQPVVRQANYIEAARFGWAAFCFTSARTSHVISKSLRDAATYNFPAFAWRYRRFRRRSLSLHRFPRRLSSAFVASAADESSRYRQLTIFRNIG